MHIYARIYVQFCVHLCPNVRGILHADLARFLKSMCVSHGAVILYVFFHAKSVDFLQIVFPDGVSVHGEITSHVILHVKSTDIFQKVQLVVPDGANVHGTESE